MKRAWTCAIAALLVAGIARAAPVLPASPAWVEIPVDELRAKYDTLWAISDVHGRLEELKQLLLASRLVVTEGEGVRWNPVARRQLLVVNGDLIDGGNESVGTVFLVQALQEQAAQSESRVVVLLGNHEAGFLENPRSASRELRKSASLPSANLSSTKMTGQELYATRFGSYLRQLPVAAVIGTWLFAHSGYLASDGAAESRAYFARLDAAVAKGDYAPLTKRSSILASHNWWKSRRKRERLRNDLSQLGLNGLVFGHEPNALRAKGTLAIDRDGWLTKLDTGLKGLRSTGMMLRCDVASIIRGRELAMAAGGASTCKALSLDGALSSLPME